MASIDNDMGEFLLLDRVAGRQNVNRKDVLN